MVIEITEESPANLSSYAEVSIAFEVQEVLALCEERPGVEGLGFTREACSAPYAKDYDAVPGHHPTELPGRFDLTNWGFFAAHVNGDRAGGAIVAWDTPGVGMLEERRDFAVLWDLRVAADHRRQGVGEALLKSVVAWSVDRGAEWLKIETQNTNVAACQFYAKRGCSLGAVNRFAYAEGPEEIQFCWYKELVSPPVAE